MKFKVGKASDWGYESEIEINSLEELEDFIVKNKQEYDDWGDYEIVIDFKKEASYDGHITIYNYYLE